MTISTFRELGSCEIELVPDDGIELSGSNLVLWRDVSGTGRHASVATAIADGFASATGPVFSGNDPAVGGRPSITWGTPNTSCLAVAAATPIPVPYTFLIAGQDQSAFSGLTSKVTHDKLALAGAGTDRNAVFRALSTSRDATPILWGSTTPIATTPRRIVGANLRSPFVLCVMCRSSTYGIVGHNGSVRAHRTMPAGPSAPQFYGLRLGRDFSNSVNGQEWTGPLSLFVLYRRELTLPEMKEAMLLASAKTGITFANGRLTA